VICLWVLTVVRASALEIPAQTELQIRLQTPGSTQGAKAGDAVDAVVIAPVLAIELLPRPEVPLNAQNATGDNLETDGQVAVLVLH
jgi:hypothetical protein